MRKEIAVKSNILIGVLFVLWILLFLFSSNILIVPAITHTYYYDGLHSVSYDLMNDGIGTRRNLKYLSNVIVDNNEEQIRIKLLDDIVIDVSLTFENAIIDLNGNIITLIDDGRILLKDNTVLTNGTIISKVEEDNTTLISAGRLSNCEINKLNLFVDSKVSTVGISAYGNLILSESNIGMKSTDGGVIGVDGNIFSHVEIKNTNIVTESKQGKSIGFSSSESGIIRNSKITSYSSYTSNEKGFISYSIGVLSSGNLEIESSHIIGIHSGVNSTGNLIVNGGIYEGYGHGGIYASGTNSLVHIVDATIKSCDFPNEFEEPIVSKTNCGMYVGGGVKCDNIKVYMNNCTISGLKYSIALRGSSGEQNNHIYISNCVLKQEIRIDNNSHKIFVGQNNELNGFSDYEHSCVQYVNQSFADPEYIIRS
jgi:hypothetical protein